METEGNLLRLYWTVILISACAVFLFWSGRKCLSVGIEMLSSSLPLKCNILWHILSQICIKNMRYSLCFILSVDWLNRAIWDFEFTYMVFQPWCVTMWRHFLMVQNIKNYIYIYIFFFPLLFQSQALTFYCHSDMFHLKLLCSLWYILLQIEIRPAGSKAASTRSWN